MSNDGILRMHIGDQNIDIDCSNNSVLTTIIPEINFAYGIYKDSMRGSILGMKMSQCLDADAAVLLAIASATTRVTGEKTVSLPVEECAEAMEFLKFLFGETNENERR